MPLSVSASRPNCAVALHHCLYSCKARVPWKAPWGVTPRFEGVAAEPTYFYGLRRDYFIDIQVTILHSRQSALEIPGVTLGRGLLCNVVTSHGGIITRLPRRTSFGRTNHLGDDWFLCLNLRAIEFIEGDRCTNRGYEIVCVPNSTSLQPKGKSEMLLRECIFGVQEWGLLPNASGDLDTRDHFGGHWLCKNSLFRLCYRHRLLKRRW